MNLTELKQRKKELDEQFNQEAAPFVKELTNKDLNLEDRWEMFGQLSELDGVLAEDSWVCHSIDKYNLEWYDNFYIERHQDVSYYELEESWTCFVEDGKVTQEQYDEWREEILASGFKGFNYDW